MLGCIRYELNLHNTIGLNPCPIHFKWEKSAPLLWPVWLGDLIGNQKRSFTADLRVGYFGNVCGVASRIHLSLHPRAKCRVVELLVCNYLAGADGKPNLSDIDDNKTLSGSDVIISCTVLANLTDPAENVITVLTRCASVEKGRRVKCKNARNEVVTV